MPFVENTSADTTNTYAVNIDGVNYQGKVETFSLPALEFDTEELLTAGQKGAIEIPMGTMRPMRWSMVLAESIDLFYNRAALRLNSPAEMHVIVTGFRRNFSYETWDMQCRLDSLTPSELMQGRIMSTTLSGNATELIKTSDGRVNFFINVERNIGGVFTDTDSAGGNRAKAKAIAAQAAALSSRSGSRTISESIRNSLRDPSALLALLT